MCVKLNNPDWKFVILGEGELRGSLQIKAKELNIEDGIYMPGAVSNVDEWLSKSYIFAFTSVSEAWGLALGESMTSGLPSVSFDCDVCPREKIEDRINGYLVPLYDVDSFVERIKDLIKDGDLRNQLASNAIKTLEKYKVEKVAKEIFYFCTIGEN